MPTRLEILQTIIEKCNADSVHVVNETGRNLSIEVVIGRNKMSDCVKNFLKEYEGSVNGIERINKGDRGFSETDDGLYRYTLVIEK